MGGLSLADALALCELLAKTDPARYERSGQNAPEASFGLRAELRRRRAGRVQTAPWTFPASSKLRVRPHEGEHSHP